MQLVEMANKYHSSITIAKDGRKVDAKSMISVLTLAAAQGAELLISADGDDAEEALESLCGIVEIGFGEE